MTAIMNPRPQSNYGDTCPLCHGNGFVVKNHETPEIYAEPKTAVYASPCPRCNGHAQMELIGLPVNFHEADITNFRLDVYDGRDLSKMIKVINSFIYNFDEWEKNGKGIYFWSKTPGSGKSFLCSCIANAIAASGKHSVRFIVLSDYLEMIKATFKPTQGAICRDEDYKRYLETDLLILDDIAVERVSDWASEKVFQLVNGRMSTGRVTIFTSNYPPERLKYDQRIVSRITKCCIVLQMPEVDIRGKIKAQEDAQFLGKILNEQE